MNDNNFILEQPPQRQPWLRAENVSFSLTEQRQIKTLLSSIDLSLYLNEFVVILGPNGAGKSTLMRLLTRFYQPTRGEIFLNGLSINHIPLDALTTQRAVMQQQTNINMSYLVYDVILLGLPQSDLPYKSSVHSAKTVDSKTSKNALATEQNAMIEQIITLTECTHLLDRDIQTLSGGEQQRVHLARTLLQIWWQIDLPAGAGIFLDEPTSALDLHYQQHLLRLIKQLTQTKQLMACAILHDVNLAALFADRIIMLVDGKIAVQGTPNEVLTHPEFLQWYRLEGFLHQHTNYPDITQLALAR